MLLTLLCAAALAAPPRLGLALGPALGTGDSARGEWFSFAPATAGTLTWGLGPFEVWGGASGSLLLADVAGDLVPSSLLQGELGLGVGSRRFSAGLYGGVGLPGPVVGLYTRVMGRGATAPAWARSVGLEGRIFYADATESTAFALLARVEPQLGREKKRERKRRRDAGEPRAPRHHDAPY
jgi:hypothetical protein